MEDRNLSLSAVAGSLGVSERTVRRWIKSGKLKAYKPGRDYRIPESALRELVEESEVSPKVQASLWPEEDPERRGYGSRVWERINSLERAADQWQRFVDEGLYDLKSVNLETLKVTDAASLAVILAHGPEAAEMKRAATDEQRERLERAERRLIDTNLDFWARVESELARSNVAYLDEVRAERAPWKEVLGSNTA